MGFFALRPHLLSLSTRISNKFTLPDRFKGTVIEKWAFYWKALLRDYAEVSIDVIREARNKPKKAATYVGIMYTTYACAIRNPDEESFQNALRRYSNYLIQIPSELQNPVSAEYVCMLEQAINQNTLRFMPLGICTLLWVDMHDRDVCVEDVKDGVTYRNFHERIIDIGFWNRWWRLSWKMRNFDVNYL